MERAGSAGGGVGVAPRPPRRRLSSSKARIGISPSDDDGADGKAGEETPLQLQLDEGQHHGARGARREPELHTKNFIGAEQQNPAPPNKRPGKRSRSGSLSAVFSAERSSSSAITGKEPPLENDFQSPTQASAYLELRLRPMIAFYQDRIPWYVRRRLTWMLVVLGCTSASTILAYLGKTSLITIVTGVAVAVAAWAEFLGLDAKLDRYNECVTALRNQETWWRRLGEVEQVSPQSVEQLVVGTENIVMAEVKTWHAAGETKEGGGAGGRAGGGAGSAGCGTTNGPSAAQSSGAVPGGKSGLGAVGEK